MDLIFFHSHICVIIVWICGETEIVNQLVKPLANHWMFSFVPFAWFASAACVLFLHGSVTESSAVVCNYSF